MGRGVLTLPGALSVRGRKKNCYAIFTETPRPRRDFISSSSGTPQCNRRLFPEKHRKKRKRVERKQKKKKRRRKLSECPGWERSRGTSGRGLPPPHGPSQDDVQAPDVWWRSLHSSLITRGILDSFDSWIQSLCLVLLW